MSSPAITLPNTDTTTLEIFAIDLRAMPQTDPFWRHRKLQQVDNSTILAKLPTGQASPMGYWLTEESSSPGPSAPYTIRVVPTSNSLENPSSLDVPDRIGSRRTKLSAKLKVSNISDGELSLTIGESDAVVVASAETWSALSEPILLAICQCWRFHAIDATLDRMTIEASADLDHASMAVLSSFRQRSRLLSSSKRIRAIFLDLPHFAGPLTDPYAFLSNEKQVEIYRSLATKLHLEEWSESIDERGESVDDTYASVTEKLCEFRNFLGGSTLEIVIILILLIEVLINVLGYIEA